MLQLEGLSIRQGGFHLTADWSVPKGARVAVIGPSGAGKSTIANLILRLYEAQQGEILIDGKNIQAYEKALFDLFGL